MPPQLRRRIYAGPASNGTIALATDPDVRPCADAEEDCPECPECPICPVGHIDTFRTSQTWSSYPDDESSPIDLGDESILDTRMLLDWFTSGQVDFEIASGVAKVTANYSNANPTIKWEALAPLDLSNVYFLKVQALNRDGGGQFDEIKPYIIFIDDDESQQITSTYTLSHDENDFPETIYFDLSEFHGAGAAVDITKITKIMFDCGFGTIDYPPMYVEYGPLIYL